MTNRLCRAYHMSKNDTKTIGISATIAAIAAVMVFATLFTAATLVYAQTNSTGGNSTAAGNSTAGGGAAKPASSSMQSPARICCQYEWPHNYSKDRSIRY